MLLAQQRVKQIHPISGPVKAFGQALQQVRKQKGLSQEKLAEDAGFDRTYISLVERGIRSPTVRAVCKFAAVLKVRPSEIIRRMETILAEAERPRGKGKE